MMKIFRNKLWLPYPLNIMRINPTGGLLRKTGTSALARNADCCCDEPVDCERFRGNADSGDVHTHDDSIWVRFPAWGNAGTYYDPAASVDDECCANLAADYELPIRDYTDTSPEYGEFTYWPGMFMPTCIPCHDCGEISDEEFTFKYLFAFCNSCEVPEGISSTGCRPYLELAPEGYEPIWTVEVTVYGYYSTACTQGVCNAFPEGSEFKLRVIYQVYGLISAAPHNHAGSFTLNRVLVDAPTDGDPPQDWAEFYCEAPETCQLFAGFEPPP